MDPDPFEILHVRKARLFQGGARVFRSEFLTREQMTDFAIDAFVR